jgi:uncharacterized protein (TIGR02001 family)
MKQPLRFVGGEAAMNWIIRTSASFGAAALVAAALPAGPALADGMPTRGKVAAAAPQPEQRRCTLSANVALASEYIFRGISQTSEGPSIQGGFDATCGLFYIGVWASNLDWGPAFRPGPDDFVTWANIEIDSYAGLKGKLGVFNWDLGVIYYAYPNSTRNFLADTNGGFDRFDNDYVELKAGVSAEIWKNGTLGATFFYSPEYQYETGDVWTVEGVFTQAFQAYWGITPTISGLIGYQSGNDGAYALRYAGGDDEYLYWNAGVTLGFLEKWSVDLRYWDTTIGDQHDTFCGGPYFQCDERFVATLKFTY